jgi:hypothetical protein
LIYSAGVFYKAMETGVPFTESQIWPSI